MKFGISQEVKFGTPNGAYSIVTATEFGDSQITFADYETKLIIDHFGRENIHVGNVASNRSKSQKKFTHVPSGKVISLNVVFPKPEKTELRLYLSKSAGFKPAAMSVWYVYVKDGDICIGSQTNETWRNDTAIVTLDVFDALSPQTWMHATDAEIKNMTVPEREVFARNRSLAREKMNAASYRCQADLTHTLFNSRHTARPFLEVHHLIPLALQKQFKVSLDTSHNLYCLCPNCHRAIHHADITTTRSIIDSLFVNSGHFSEFDQSLVMLYNMYGVEEIA